MNPEEKKRKSNFENKRKNHYGGEFKAVLAMRSQRSMEDDDED